MFIGHCFGKRRSQDDSAVEVGGTTGGLPYSTNFRPPSETDVFTTKLLAALRHLETGFFTESAGCNLCILPKKPGF